jgi:hypothetical protein
MSRYTFGASGYGRTRLPADETPPSTVADPHDPRHLPPAQKIALLTLRGGGLAQACVSQLRADGAPSPNELDYIALARAGLSLRQSNNRRALTPIGKFRADDLARAIAQASGLHVISYGMSAGARFCRCSCGEFFTSHARAIRDSFTKVIAAGGKHLAHVERRERLTSDVFPEGATKQALREIFSETPR